MEITVTDLHLEFPAWISHLRGRADMSGVFKSWLRYFSQRSGTSSNTGSTPGSPCRLPNCEYFFLHFPRLASSFFQSFSPEAPSQFSPPFSSLASACGWFFPVLGSPSVTFSRWSRPWRARLFWPDPTLEVPPWNLCQVFLNRTRNGLES